MNPLSDVLVVIKGGTTDVGLALAQVVGRAGARPVIVDADAAAVDAAVASLRWEGIDARASVPDGIGPDLDGQVLVFAMEAPEELARPPQEAPVHCPPPLRLVAVNE